MTANELADLIENEDTLWLEPHLNTIATMLRQQQAEIDSLQKNLDVALMIVNKPAKTLTDEEILKVIKKHESINGNIDTYDVLACVKEILLKASEQ